MQNKIIAIVLGVIVVAGLSFFGGMKYGQMSGGGFGGGMPPDGMAFSGGVPDLNSEVSIRKIGQGGGLIAGEIISIGENNLTIEMFDGGSKTVYWSDSTEVTKATAGATTDLIVGAQVTVTGSESNGTTTAKTIQIK
ncbi:MAG: hypothetical protein WC702_00115 [Patescibacteria group bacterium]|jgi:hypothetical protein